MPLGKISKAQIAKGFEALEQVEEALKKKQPRSKLAELSSQFYTVIPHNFSRSLPPVIDSDELLHKKMDMLTVSEAPLCFLYFSFGCRGLLSFKSLLVILT